MLLTAPAAKPSLTLKQCVFHKGGPAIIRQTPRGVTAELPLRAASSGGSGSFLVRADDGKRYWCKSLNNLQSPRVPANEQIAGRMGTLIGAALCEAVLVRIPPDLVGWEFRPGRGLEEGWAHGSAAVDPVVETRTLDHRSRDENARRHASFFALYDWLIGQDPQWLVADGSDFAYHSHDHGHYFPGGPDWTVQTLQEHADDACALPADPSGLDPQELVRLADCLCSIDQAALEGALATLPPDWPISDAELDEMIRFLDHRRVPVASRLRLLAA